MRKLLLLLLIAPLFASSQITSAGDTLRMVTFKGAQRAYIYLKKDWPSIPASLRRGIVFLHGDGEEGTGTTDTAKLYLNGPMRQIRNFGYRPPGNTCFYIAPQRSAAVNFWDESDQSAIITLMNSMGASSNKRVLSGYSGGGSGTYFFSFAHPENWSAIHVTAGAYGSQGSYVEDKYAIKSIPGVKVSHSTTDGSQAISNSVEALDSTLTINALNPYLVETDFYFGLGHTIIDDTVYNKVDQYVRWYGLHDQRYDTTVALHIDSLDRGFDDHFYRKTKRLIDSMQSGSLKTSFLARAQAAWDLFYGSGAERYPVAFRNTTASATGWKVSTANVAGTVTSGLINAVNNTASTINLTQVSAGSAQERVYTRNYNQYHGLPPGFYAQNFEMFTNVSKFRYSNLPNGDYWVIIDGTSETTPGTETGLRVTINGVTTSMRLEYRNTNKYVWRGPFTVTGGTLDVDIQDYVAGSVGHVSSMELIKAGSYAPVNQPPSVDAGADQVKTLPTTTATLTGTASDVDGTISSYAWTKYSGPSGGTITSPSSASTGITALQAGRYVFQLTATDNNGATGFDTVAIQVNDVLGLYNAPDKIVYKAQASTQPPFTLSAVDSTGVSVSWSWTRLSGSGSAAITNGNTATATISNLVGEYHRFRVIATSAGGATDADTITVWMRDLMNRGRELPCRVGTKQWFKVGDVIGGGTSTTSFSMQYVTRDNKIPGLMGGDTIMLYRNPNNNGIWNRVTFGDIEAPAGCPIVIVPDTSGTGIVRLADTALNNTSAFYIASHDSNVVKNVEILGTYNYAKKGLSAVYGFQIGNRTTNNTKYFYRGVAGNFLNGLTLKGIALFNCSTGFSLKTISDSTKPFTIFDNFRNTILIEDCYADSAINEMMYIGTTDRQGLGQGNDGPPPKGNYVTVNRFIGRGSGWDGPQFSYYEGASIKNSVVLRTGQSNQAGQIAAIFPGGSVGPVTADSNFMRYMVGGPSLLGEGKTSWRNNIIWDYQQMYNSQARDVGVTVYGPLQIFNEQNYYIRETGSPGVRNANSGGENFLPGAFRYNTILSNKTIGQFFTSDYSDTIAGNVIFPAATTPETVLDTSRLANMPSYLMYKFMEANPFNRMPSFYDIFAPVDPPDPNQPPTAEAGTYPPSSATSVQLFGSASDVDGTYTVLWSQTAGTAATITNGTTLSPTISGLTVGSRTFRLRVTDNDGAVTDDFATLVTTANQPPVINAATTDTTITGSSMSLYVSATDPEGSALTYSWSAAPGTPSISAPNSAVTDVTGLVAGTYVFTVQASDGVNTTTRNINVTVQAAPIPGQKYRVRGRFRKKP